MGKGNCREDSAWTRDRGWGGAGPLAQAEGERQRWVLGETPGSSSARSQLETGVVQKSMFLKMTGARTEASPTKGVGDPQEKSWDNYSPAWSSY